MNMRNYPKNRKSYIPTTSQKYWLLQNHSLNEVQRIWTEKGMYGAGEYFRVSPKVIHDLVQLNGWQRPLPPHLVKAVQNGCWKVGKNHYLVNITKDRSY